MSVRPRPVPSEAEVADAAALLGVDPGAAPTEVKRAWRAAVRVTHPDRVDGPARAAAEHLAAVLNEARDVLLAVAGTPRGPVPFGSADAAEPAAPTGRWEHAVTQGGADGHPDPPTAPAAQPVPDLPRPVIVAPNRAPAGTAPTVASGRARPVRETIGIVVLLALVAAAAVLVVYQLVGGLLLP